jgi:enoyl-CoA hydratase
MDSDEQFSTIEVEQRGFVRWLTLNRPDRRNAISPLMVEELGAALSAARASKVTRVLGIKAAGKVFCAGADLGDGPGERPSLDVLTASTNLFAEIEDFPQPVVGVVQGIACAGGVELLLACDLIIAAESVRIADIHANVGLIPGAGGAYRLVQRVGIGMARRMLFSGDFFTAAELSPAGLVDFVVSDDELSSFASDLTERLATKSPLAAAATKRLANGALHQTRNDAMKSALLENAAHMETKDYLEGLTAFAERRSPRYRWE